MDENTKEEILEVEDKESQEIIVADYVSPKTVIDEMTKIVERRLDGMKFFVPLLLTVITSVIAYLFAISYNKESLWIAYIVCAYLLLCLTSILIAYYPKANYTNIYNAPKWIKRLQKKTHQFYPWDVKSYLYLDGYEFREELEEFLNRTLSIDELFFTNILSLKIGELRYKRRLIAMSYSIIIVGAFLMTIMFMLAYCVEVFGWGL